MKYKFAKGYTLIEVIIVIIMISIILAILPLNTSSVYDISLKAAADQIVLDLRWARIQAILSNETYNFRIYKTDDIYKKDDDYKSDYIIYTIDQNNKFTIKKEGTFSANYTLYKNLNSVKVTADYYDKINFTPFGTSRAGTAVLKTNNNKFIKIAVNYFGRIRIENE